MYTINDLLDLSKTIAAPLFEGKTYPWEVLADIGDFIIALGSTLPEEEYEKRGENVWIARDAEVFPSAYIGPVSISSSPFFITTSVLSLLTFEVIEPAPICAL